MVQPLVSTGGAYSGTAAYGCIQWDPEWPASQQCSVGLDPQRDHRCTGLGPSWGSRNTQPYTHWSIRTLVDQSVCELVAGGKRGRIARTHPQQASRDGRSVRQHHPNATKASAPSKRNQSFSLQHHPNATTANGEKCSCCHRRLH